MKKRKRRTSRGGYPYLDRRGNGYWYIRWAETRKESLRTRDEAEASQMFNLRMAAVREEKVRQIGLVRHMRLSEFRVLYLAMRRERELIGDLVAGTVKNDELALKALEGAIGDIPLRSIDAGAREKFKRKLLLGAKDPERRKGGIDAYMRSLRAAFNWALPDPANKKPGYIDYNPFSKPRGSQDRVMFKRGKRLPKFLPQEALKAVRSLLKEKIDGARRKLMQAETRAREIEASGAALKRADGWMLRQAQDNLARASELWYMVHWYIYSGLRRAELVDLEWPRVDLSMEMMRVVGKGSKERTAPIVPALMQLIHEMGPRDLGPVFPRWRSKDYVSQLVKKVLREAGLDDHVLHHLRHTYGSYAAMGGVDLRTIQMNMGHEDIGTTMLYADVADEHRRQETQKKLRFGFEEEG